MTVWYLLLLLLLFINAADDAPYVSKNESQVRKHSHVTKQNILWLPETWVDDDVHWLEVFTADECQFVTTVRQRSWDGTTRCVSPVQNPTQTRTDEILQSKHH